MSDQVKCPICGTVVMRGENGWAVCNHDTPDVNEFVKIAAAQDVGDRVPLREQIAVLTDRLERMGSLVARALPELMGGYPDLFSPACGWDEWEDEAKALLVESGLRTPLPMFPICECGHFMTHEGGVATCTDCGGHTRRGWEGTLRVNRGGNG